MSQSPLPNVLVVIPARGGSKGIPRKNLRPLSGKPLIYYSIKAALNSKFNTEVYVSTDDEEITFFAKSFGAQVHYRDSTLASDNITLDPVIYNAFNHLTQKSGKTFELIVTLQPTSPLVTSVDIDNAIELMIKNQRIDTVISAVNDTHLTWKKIDKKYEPNYIERLNRQLLTPVFRETGGFLITRSSIIGENNRIGSNVELFELKGGKALDIDNYEDWNLAEYYLQRRKILFCISGNREIGLGHVYNCLILANEILNHRVIFLVDKESELAYKKIENHNFDVRIQQQNDIVQDITEVQPDLIINDRLDTSSEYMQSLKNLGYKTFNIEDLGPGATLADCVVNAIYPENKKYLNHYYGPDYFCLRDEFLISDPIVIKPKVGNVVLTFGGTDPLNLTKKTLEAVYDYCVENSINLYVILGLGYTGDDIDELFPEAIFYRNLPAISEVMKLADIAFSSAGRTTYELASLGVPSIILSQNERELTHFFASEENGFKSLGLGSQVTHQNILKEFTNLCNDFHTRREMHISMVDRNIRKGKTKVIKLIQDLLK